MISVPAFLDRLRAGENPSDDELIDFISGLTTGTVSDAQAAAFAMAICWRGLKPSGRATLTRAMASSGLSLPRQSEKPRLDKHSTGGIGDSVSLILAPALAAIGAEVPMISGRALGHTGGTLDKLEALPGLSTELGREAMGHVLREAGCVIAAAGPEIAPADRRLYGVRDQTGTVASPALITASILSKKLAASLDAIVLDVKTGSGAFMQDTQSASELAHSLVKTAKDCGLSASAFVTAMDQPLLPAIGSGPEMALCLSILRGDVRSSRIEELVLTLGAAVAAQANLGTEADMRQSLSHALKSGHAFEHFSRMARAMGAAGEPSPASLPKAAVSADLCAPTSGVLERIDGKALGLAVQQLGPRHAPGMGLTDIVAPGTKLDAGAPLARIHAAHSDALEKAIIPLSAAFQIGDAALSAPLPLVIERV